MILVWLIDERRTAVLKELHAFHSIVCYTEHGVEYEVMVMNEDYTIYEGQDIDTD